MRKIILITMIMVGVFGFSQEKLNRSSLELKSDFRLTQIRLELKKNFKKIKVPLKTLFIFRFNRFEISEGVIIPIQEGVSFTPSIVGAYYYETKDMGIRFRGSLKLTFPRFYGKVNYGSDWLEHDVTTKFAYGIIGDVFMVGTASINENVGPLVIVKLKIGKKNQKNFKGKFLFVNNKFRVSLKIDIDELIKKSFKKKNKAK